MTAPAPSSTPAAQQATDAPGRVAPGRVAPGPDAPGPDAPALLSRTPAGPPHRTPPQPRVSRRPLPTTRPARWLVFLVVGGLFGLLHLTVRTDLVDGLALPAIGTGSTLAIWFGTRRLPAASRAPWLLVAVGQFATTAGDSLFNWLSLVLHVEPYPSAADGYYLSAYPFLAVGLLMLIRRNETGRQDRNGVLDSAVVTVGLGLLCWVLLARPALADTGQSGLAVAVGLAYPVADILLIAVLARLLTGRVARTPSFRLLVVAISSLLLADAVFSVVTRVSSYDGGAVDVFFVASYLAWGASALHPSVSDLSAPAAGPLPPFTRRRLAALTTAVLAAPVVLLVQLVAGVPVDSWAVAGCSIVLFVLVVARLYDAIEQAARATRESERLRTALAYQAAHDTLTDLPNRAQVLETLKAALARAQRAGGATGLLFIDLDGFKTVNDTLGHSAGDRVLVEIGRRVRSVLRAGDTVGRLGGDEFLVVLENVGQDSDLVVVADKLVRAAAQPVQVGDRVASVGASIGITVSRDGSTDVSRLVEEADMAAYRAKAGGRGRAEVFDAAVRSSLEARSELVDALRDGLVADELVLHYQPVFDLPTATVRGYEALVRWERPGHGLVPPAEFIPVAEQSDVICELERWVIARATADLAQWIRDGAVTDPATSVSVNVSARHLRTRGFVATVTDALTASGLAPGRLEIEVTETVVIEDPFATDNLRALRAAGVRTTIDDFGTGYSSISQLGRLPVDIVKIDRSFVADETPGARALVELMVRAAHCFGLRVVAEGVEDPEQLAELRAVGCDLVQGFLLGRPVPGAPAALLAGADTRRSRG